MSFMKKKDHPFLQIGIPESDLNLVETDSAPKLFPVSLQ